ncbi:MAG: hypothetical protein RLZZ157_129 [Pseudomonadota bacterium]|jgi:uncharacterized protein YifN (PemK superfamily)
MPLNYHPRLGEILLCNYESGFVAPEMTKIRPVVVVSPRLRRRDALVAVVPLSTTPPNPVESHHFEIVLGVPLPRPFNSLQMWAKCDMLATVARSRLDRFKVPRKQGSTSRQYVSGQLEQVQLIGIRKAILNGLGLGSLTIHL